MSVTALSNDQIADLKSTVTPQEWEARVDLAACYRLIDHYGMSDLTSNHITVRVPGEEGAFLINSWGMLYEEMTASSLTKIDHDGNVLSKPDFGDLDYGVNRAGFVIHSAIHKARPDVNCIIHTHTWAGMAISMLECGLLPATQTSIRFAEIGYHDFNGIVVDLAEQELLVESLGDKEAMILRNHGLLTTGATIPEAFNCMQRLELSCKTQLAAMSCNSKLVEVPEDILAATREMYQSQMPRPLGVLDWPALLRKLDRIDPSFRD
jgi:ribulose-5-phosphate 4-epimerase/fuculose-1-phosphate aldolase